ncbi:hypothetical protein V866_006253 [Kwoniella sp. B9012]
MPERPVPSPRTPWTAGTNKRKRDINYFWDNELQPRKFPKVNSSTCFEAETGSDPSPSSKWHRYHSDGNVILRADDGTLFGADSWRLAKASDVFKDMFDIPQPSIFTSTSPRTASRWMNEDQPIDMEVTPFILETFLNLINVSISSLPGVLSFSQMRALHGLCDKFIVTYNIRYQVNHGIELAGVHDPWDLLVFACGRDDVHLGRKAIGYMGREGFTKVYSNPSTNNNGSREETPLKFKPFWTRLHLLSRPWQNALLSKILSQPTFTPTTNAMTASTTGTSAKTRLKDRIQRKPSGRLVEEQSGTYMMVIESWEKVVSGFNPR